MRYLNICIIALTLSLFSAIAFADTTQSRDGDGNKIQGAAFGFVKSKSLGTKGNTFTCWTTSSLMSWEVRVVATTTTDNAMLPFLMYHNSSSTTPYPITDKFFQWQNSPVSKSPTILKVCLKGYSTATTPVPKTGYLIGQ